MNYRKPDYDLTDAAERVFSGCAEYRLKGTLAAFLEQVECVLPSEDARAVLQAFRDLVYRDMAEEIEDQRELELQKAIR